MNKNEAFARVLIDGLLADQGWAITNPNAVRYEVVMADGTRADYVLCDRHGHSLAVVEAKRDSISPADAAEQAKGYAKQLGIPYVFMTNGAEVLFWEWERDAYPHPVKTFFKQDDLERRFASLQLRRDVLNVPIDLKIAGRDYQQECIQIASKEIKQGRRKLLLEMATGTGKTRTAAALIKRLFEANAITRVLFLVDRIPLAKQTEDAFAEHLPDYPAYVLRAGRRFQDEKRITITTLQSMINTYGDYSSGYFDLIISDECHRSIYGKWSGVLKYFDGVQIGLTATPCVATQEELDGAGHADEEDKLFVRDTLRFFEVDKPTFSYKLKDAIRDGVLAPYQVYQAKTVKTAAEGGFPVKKSELDWSAMSAETRAEFELLFADTAEIIIDPSALERRFTIPERNRAIVREFREVLEKGFTDHKGVLRMPLIGKTIVFAVNKKHAETLAQLFDAEFADKKPSPDIRFADYVVSGAGPDDSLDAMAKIRRFKKEPFPQILVSVNMLDTGFDCPEVCNLVFARFTRSAILYQQMRGRGTRKTSKKPIFTMFDFVGVCDYHGDEDTLGGGGLMKEPAKKKHYEPKRLLSLDIDDHIDPTTREWISIDENGNMLFPEASEQKAAELGTKFEAWRLAQQNLNAEQDRWLRILGSQIRANADSLDEVMPEHFAFFHTFSQMGGLNEAQRVFGTAEALQALIDSLNAALFNDPGTKTYVDDGSHPAAPHYQKHQQESKPMPLTPDMRRSIDQIRDYLFGGGYPDPVSNAEQLSFLFFFYLVEGIDTENKLKSKVLKTPYESLFAGDWTIRNPLNAEAGQMTIPRDRFRWSVWAKGLSGEALVRFLRDEVFAFFAEMGEAAAHNFMDGARLAIIDPTVLTQVVNLVDGLRLDASDSDTKGDLFEHVLRQIRQAGELGQFRTPRHVIHTIVEIIDPKVGETIYDPAAGTAGFLVAAYNHIRLANSSPSAIADVELDGKKHKRGLGDKLSAAQTSALQSATFYGNDVDPKMVRLATMNLTLRGLANVRVRLRNVLTTNLDNEKKEQLGLPAEGYHVVLANPPFAGRVDKDRVVEEVKVGTSTATELLFLKYMMDNLRPGGRCGVIVPEGVLFGSTGAHKELRRQLIENNRVEAVLSLPGGVFQPYSGVKTSVLFFRKGGSTENVLFLHADNDGYKLDANHDNPIETDDLPGLAAVYREKEANLATWRVRDPDAEWTAQWWFADAAAVRTNDFNLSAGRYRPMSQSAVEHRDPRVLLDELAAIEAEIVEEVEALKAALAEQAA